MRGMLWWVTKLGEDPLQADLAISRSDVFVRITKEWLVARVKSQQNFRSIEESYLKLRICIKLSAPLANGSSSAALTSVRS